MIADEEIRLDVLRILDVAEPAKLRVAHGIADLVATRRRHRKRGRHDVEPMLEELGKARAEELGELRAQRRALARNRQEAAALHVLLDAAQVLRERFVNGG